MSQWRIVPLHRTLGEHSSIWDRVQRTWLKSNPMLDSRFVDALLRNFGDGSEHLCIHEASATVTAVCILRPRGKLIWSTFLPAQAQIGLTLVPDPTLIPSLFTVLPKAVVELDFLCNDPDFGGLAHTASPIRDAIDHALTINVKIVGAFESYWNGRSKKLTQNISRYQRRIAADGIGMRFTCIADTADIKTALTRYAHLESSGWKGKQGTAINIADRQGVFYSELLEKFSSTNSAEVFELWFDSRLAASRLAISADGTTVFLKTAYDESLSQYSPGRLLLHQVLLKKFESTPGGCIEFYTDANADLLSWASDQRWIQHVTYYRNRLSAHSLKTARTIQSIFRSDDEVGNSQTSFQTEVFCHPDEFPDDVEKLMSATESIDIGLGTTWYRNLIKTGKLQDQKVRFYVCRHQGQPIVVLPILVEQSGWGNSVTALASFYTALFAPAMAPQAKALHLSHLIRRIAVDFSPVRQIKLAPMDPQSMSHRALSNGIRSAGMVPFHFFCFGNWYLNTTETQWDKYISERSGALRNTIKRKRRKLAADDGTLEIVTGGDRLQIGIDAYSSVYNSSWKIAEPFPEFIPELIRACSERGWLRLGIAWLKGKPIAVQLWIVSNQKAYIYKLAYREDSKEYAAGTLLTASLLQHVICHDRVTEVDYLIGDDPYKKSWMSQRRERWGIVAFPLNTPSGALGLALEALRRLFKPRLLQRTNGNSIDR